MILYRIRLLKNEGYILSYDRQCKEFRHKYKNTGRLLVGCFFGELKINFT
jgi:hypothetical protein